MVALSEKATPTVDAIFAAYERARKGERRRGHLGASEVGRQCGRELWYRFRWAARPDFDGRMLRLFDTGHREEARLIEELRAAGVEVHDRDERGRQWRVTALGGHFAGSMDGAALGLLEAPKTWHVFEAKTMNAKGFARLRKEGVERAKPEHFAQMQTYMGLTGMKRAAYFAVCKDDDRIHYERVRFDRATFDAIVERARQIIEASGPLTRVSSDPMGYPCSFCDFRGICHEPSMLHDSRVADVSCRTCVHATPVVDDSTAARWVCERHGHDLSLREQEAACEDHVFIPALVPVGTPVDSRDGAVLYQIGKKGPRFANAAGDTFPPPWDVPAYSSRQLAAMPLESIGVHDPRNNCPECKGAGLVVVETRHGGIVNEPCFTCEGEETERELREAF